MLFKSCLIYTVILLQYYYLLTCPLLHCSVFPCLYRTAFSVDGTGPGTCTVTTYVKTVLSAIQYVQMYNLYNYTICTTIQYVQLYNMYNYTI